MSPDPGQGAPRPPSTSREPVTRTLHGVDRTDPYGWLRAVDSPAVAEHLQAERDYYDAAVQETAPLARTLAAAIVARIPPTERGVTVDRPGWTYYTVLAGGSEHGQIRRYPRGEPRAGHDTDTTPPAGDELVLDIDGLRGESAYVDLGSL